MPLGSLLPDDPLRLWRIVTDLSPRALPVPGPAGPAETVKDYLPEHHLPWEPVTGHLSLHRERTWRHRVYAGLVDHARLVAGAVAAGTMPETPDDASAGKASESRRPQELTAVFALEVDEEGRVLPETLELSRAAWRAAGAPGPDYASQLPRWREQLLEHWAHREVLIRGRGQPGDGGRRLTQEDLAQALSLTDRILGEGILSGPVSATVRVASRRVRRTRRPEGSPRVPVLNHPSAAALDRADHRTRFRQAAAGLLGVDAPEHPADVMDSRTRLYYAVAPQQVPLGAPEPSPATAATQFAVDAALSRLGAREGLWTCPPRTAAGTPGPETSREIAAAILVHRARALAEIPDPAEVFDPEPLPWTPGRTVPVPHPDLAGHEFLHAVVDPASSASGPVPGTGPYGVRVVLAPGMPEHPPFQALPAGREIGVIDAIDAVLNVLPRAGADPAADQGEWERTADAALAAQERTRELLASRQRFHEAVPLLLRAEEMTRDIGQNIRDAQASVDALTADLVRAERAHRTAQMRRHGLSDAIAAHLHEEPGVWRRAASLGRARVPWRERLEDLRTAQETAAREEDACQTRVGAARRRLHAAQQNRDGLRDELEQSQETARALQAELAAYPHPEHAIDQEWLGGGWSGTGPACPWLDPEVQRARTGTYRLAVRLHALTLLHLPREFRDGLKAARDVLSGRPVPSAEAMLAAVQVLSAIFPEIRVDPNLLPSLLRGLGERRIGWLLYDDAARVSPAVAYAGLLGARRGVLLPGPPGRQAAGEPAAGPTFLAPDAAAQRALARAASCGASWAPAVSSAYDLGLGREAAASGTAGAGTP
ncbi:hypothetical protein [Rothia kristinae]|uniref:hypothetical protein n=1 Tax=Rothia kristinae TaxID=37923 RepID=UPI001010CE9A|nr:hypothetical protein [Rothia kristinae]